MPSQPLRLLTPLRLALVFTVLDFPWALQALSAAPRHAGSNVALVSLGLWLLLHLPAALLTALLLCAAGGALKGAATGLPFWALALLGGAGLCQTFVLVYGLAAWRLSRRRFL